MHHIKHILFFQREYNLRRACVYQIVVVVPTDGVLSPYVIAEDSIKLIRSSFPFFVYASAFGGLKEELFVALPPYESAESLRHDVVSIWSGIDLSSLSSHGAVSIPTTRTRSRR